MLGTKMMTRKELMRMMPKNADDIAAAECIIAIGHPAIAPVMRDMVDTMRVAQSPVADAFAAYLGRLGQAAVQPIGQGLMKENCWLRHRIFTIVLPQWPKDVVAQLRNLLTMVATHPDAYDNDLLCVQLLIHHRLADLTWLEDWLIFKRERWTARNELLLTIEQELKHAQ
jgi:hypothetical protein